jgi:uncharacterized membrane protein YagU involved in acid resistance
MNAPAWLGAAFLSTLILTSIESGAQAMHLSRMSVPYLLGASLTASRDRAKVIGFFAHLINGLLFALVYVWLFNLIGSATFWMGALIGLAHAAIVLLVVIPLLPSIHPRMASYHAGPTEMRQLEPPGAFALNYGFSTPAVIVIGHMIYGMMLGGLYRL